jgi:hypothetical protein
MLISLGQQRNTTRESFSSDEEGERYKAMTLI